MVKLVSVIIPTYNERLTVNHCLVSLFKQSYRPLEIIVVDDGSTDNTVRIVKNFERSTRFARPRRLEIKQSRARRTIICQLLTQQHLGPGKARNLGAKHANGDILVFVDADMTFDRGFIKDLTKPIFARETIGTFSKNEMNANSDNIWSKCWNLNRTGSIQKLIPENSPDLSPVFRAILKKEFVQVGGFTSSGEYTDDWSLSEKLDKKASLATEAIYYHSNPSNLDEVWKQAKWFATNKFISGDPLRSIKSLIFYSFVVSVPVAIIKTLKYRNLSFIFFRIYFDLAVWTAIPRAFISKIKAK